MGEDGELRPRGGEWFVHTFLGCMGKKHRVEAVPPDSVGNRKAKAV